MELQHEFTVPVPVGRAWPVLLDVERVAPCMPGATLESVDGDEIIGRLKVKVGPITVTYRGTARFANRDDAAHKITIEGSGKESRGTGTASATVNAQLHDEGDSTRVTVLTNLNVTGRPAQFGRNVMGEVGGKLIDRFADCLADELGGGSAPDTSVSAEAGHAATPPPSADGPGSGAAAAPPATSVRQGPTRPRDEAIDLLDVAGGPMLKRAAPVLGGLAALLALLFAVRRRRRRH